MRGSPVEGQVDFVYVNRFVKRSLFGDVNDLSDDYHLKLAQDGLGLGW